MPPESTVDVLQLARNSFRSDDAPAIRRLLDQFPEFKAKINEPIGDFDSPAITQVRSRAMLDVLLDAGADINARSRWWAGGFGLLDNASPELAAYAIERGATITPHAAARLGLLDKLREIISADPAQVHARGGDGQTPLHFAASVEIADYVLENGADINARDIDHESTPTQYMVAKRPNVARHLIRRGCKTDILAAAALGDMGLAGRLLDEDPDFIRMRVSDEYFPMVGGRSGGTIYQWELGWHVSAVQVARKFGHPGMFDFLMARSPADEKLLNACWLHDEGMVKSLLAQDPDLTASLTPAGRRQLAHAARNHNTAAALLMLEAGLPVDTYTQHHATPLHWAAWHGNAGLVRQILRHGPPLDDTSNDYGGTAADWAIHGSQNGWHLPNGEHGAALDLLLDAGVPRPEQLAGTESVQAVLRRHGVGSE
jgi:Ankyrin repeats (many copies)/Ankyrin repeat